jgi:hypothetical protein
MDKSNCRQDVTANRKVIGSKVKTQAVARSSRKYAAENTSEEEQLNLLNLSRLECSFVCLWEPKPCVKRRYVLDRGSGISMPNKIKLSN